MKPPERYQSEVIAQRELSPGTYELTLARAGLSFRPGHEVYLHGAAPIDDRQYSIVSGESEKDLRFLYRLIPTGTLSPQLASLRPGDPIAFTGPTGKFFLRDSERPAVCVATGTGIAPFVSFVLSHPEIDLTLFHGVRDPADLFYHDAFASHTVTSCISGDATSENHFAGRVTEALRSRSTPWPADTQFYLCGANVMILETRRILLEQGVDDRDIVSEAYYFA